MDFIQNHENKLLCIFLSGGFQAAVFLKYVAYFP